MSPGSELPHRGSPARPHQQDRSRPRKKQPDGNKTWPEPVYLSDSPVLLAALFVVPQLVPGYVAGPWTILAVVPLAVAWAPLAHADCVANGAECESTVLPAIGLAVVWDGLVALGWVLRVTSRAAEVSGRAPGMACASRPEQEWASRPLTPGVHPRARHDSTAQLWIKRTCSALYRGHSPRASGPPAIRCGCRPGLRRTRAHRRQKLR
jgi:hypothetical protein